MAGRSLINGTINACSEISRFITIGVLLVEKTYILTMILRSHGAAHRGLLPKAQKKVGRPF